MPVYHAPDVYIEEKSGGARPIQAVGTSTAAFVGVAPNAEARIGEVVAVNNWTEFVGKFAEGAKQGTPLSSGVWGFFLNGGSRCYVVNVGPGGREKLPAEGQIPSFGRLAQYDDIAIVAAPGYTDKEDYDKLLVHCELLKDRVAILDGQNVTDLKAIYTDLRPRESLYGAVYFPWIKVSDPFSGQVMEVGPSAHVAGIWARTDATRGVHKAPANEIVRGALDVNYRFTQTEVGLLNDNCVNCIRLFTPEGIHVWGARTLAGASSEWRYLNVRRLFNMIEESIAKSTRWIVFEPNTPALWRAIRRDVGAFLTSLWRDGALMGRTPEEAFFVKCDDETNPQSEIDMGKVTTVIGIAPVKPAEFVIFQISQSSAGAQKNEGGA